LFQLSRQLKSLLRMHRFAIAVMCAILCTAAIDPAVRAVGREAAPRSESNPKKSLPHKAAAPSPATVLQANPQLLYDMSPAVAPPAHVPADPSPARAPDVERVVAVAAVSPPAATDAPGQSAGAAPPLSKPLSAAASETRPRVVWMEVTAYCACKRCCGAGAKGLTASGKTVSYNRGRFVAADVSVFGFGTRLSIPGYNDGQSVEVIDTGSAIKGHKLDVFFPSHRTALAWGHRWVPVTVAN
jgi:3D (Asp-Asp-Asp) domain-containing protein